MKKTFTLLFTLLIFAQAWASTEWTSGTATVTLAENGTVTISGNEMEDYTSIDQTPWSDFRNDIKKVVAENTKIGQRAFSNCLFLESVELKNSVRTLRGYAFFGCSNLKSVTLPENNSFTFIGHSAFWETGLTSITIPASVNEIAAHGIAIPTKESVIDLNLYAPAQGTYLFEIITRAMDAYDVALLYQGGYVASLYDDQPIALDLDKGTTGDYAIRISRKMPTDITNTQSADGQCTKALIDGHMYIFQGGHVYDAQGKTVK